MNRRDPDSVERRRLLRMAATAPLLSVAVGTPGAAFAAGNAVDPDAQRWRTLAEHYFGDRPIADGTAVLGLDAPGRAHDAAIVPISVHALDAARPIHRLHLFVDRNPLPLAGIVDFAEAARDWRTLQTRIRINEYTHVRVVGELADGSLLQVARFVKAAGGCSAPAMADMDAALANAGRMKVLLGQAADALPSSPLHEAVIRISHPNSSGMQFDQLSRHYIPAFFVDHIAATLDGEALFSVQTNFSMSENPAVQLRFEPRHGAAGETLSATATDSRGNGYRHGTGS